MSIDVNIYKLKIGDKVEVTRDGRTHLMEVWAVTAPGFAGRRESAGPLIHAWIRPGGYGVAFDYSTTGIDVTEAVPRGTAHYENYLRYKAQQDALPQPFTASQQRTPLQYLPYAHYPETPKEN